MINSFEVISTLDAWSKYFQYKPAEDIFQNPDFVNLVDVFGNPRYDDIMFVVHKYRERFSPSQLRFIFMLLHCSKGGIYESSSY